MYQTDCVDQAKQYQVLIRCLTTISKQLIWKALMCNMELGKDKCIAQQFFPSKKNHTCLPCIEMKPIATIVLVQLHCFMKWQGIQVEEYHSVH